jgi:hypothetical protein
MTDGYTGEDETEMKTLYQIFMYFNLFAFILYSLSFIFTLAGGREIAWLQVALLPVLILFFFMFRKRYRHMVKLEEDEKEKERRIQQSKKRKKRKK